MLLKIVTLIGWRGAIGVAVGAVVFGGAAHAFGRFVERQVCASRIETQIARHTIQLMERNNARIDAALAARREAERHHGAGPDGSLSDDPFRRD